MSDFINPSTPQSWIVATLRSSAPLLTLLGAPHIYEVGDVPRDENDKTPPMFVCVVPPVGMKTRWTHDKWPQSLDARFLIYAETQTDRLPAWAIGLDDVLGPVHLALQEALFGATTPNAPTGGKVWGCEPGDFYTPRPLTLDANTKLGQKGLYVSILAT